MKNPKYHVYLTNEERSEVLKSLIDLKNEMIVQGKYTDVLDEIIVKLYKARKKNIIAIQVKSLQAIDSIVLTLHICNDIITLIKCKVICCVYTYKLW